MSFQHTPGTMTDLPPTDAAAEYAAFRIGPPLTKREARVLNYLITYLTQNAYQPSLREICAACQCASTKTASELITSLGEKGYVELPTSGSRPARAIRIVGIELTVTRRLVPPGRSHPRPEDHEQPHNHA